MANTDYTAEIWRAIAIAPDYEVSDFGRVRRVVVGPSRRATCMLKCNASTRYAKVDLTTPNGVKTVSVHRLVLAAFHGPAPTPLHQGAHGDGNCTNNRADNLRWATPMENHDDKRRHGTMNLGDRHWTRKSPERVLRGDSHPKRLRPETVTRGEAQFTAKLTAVQVTEIRAVPHYWGVNSRLAETYGVTNALISGIRSRRLWKHIP